MDNKAKALKVYHTHIAVFLSAMNAYPKKISDEQFLEESKASFIRLLPNLPLHPGSKRHLFNNLMPALATISAVYLVLKEHGYSVDQIGRLEYEAYVQFFNKIPWPVRRLIRSFMVSPLFETFMKSTTDKMTASGRKDTFFIKYSYQKQPYRATTMACSQCGMITFMKDNNLEEMKHICNVFDFAQAESFGLGLQQPSCIGQDDDTCRYVFTKDDSDTVLP
jgi:hypothetical protein